MCAYWNKTRGAVFKKIKKTIYYKYAIQLVCVLKWNKRDSFQKTTKKNNLLQYVIQSCVCILKWNKRDSFQNKKQFITVCYSTCVHIEMKQEGSFQKNPIDDNMLLNSCAKWRGSFQNKTNLLQYAIQLMCILKWNKRESFQKNNNLLQYAFQPVWCILKWNNRDCFQKTKKKQFITVCYSTCVHIEMKQEGQFSKNNKKNNLLQYAIQLVCVLKWNKRGSFQKKSNWCIEMKQEGQFSKKSNYATELMCEMKQEGQFSKNNNLLQYAFQLMCILKWNKRGQFSKKSNWWQYATQLMCEMKGQFSKISKQFITVCFSTHVHIEIKQERQFSKKSNWWQYSTELMCDMKGQFSKKSKQFITVCFSTCVVHIEMKQ